MALERGLALGQTNRKGAQGMKKKVRWTKMYLTSEDLQIIDTSLEYGLRRMETTDYPSYETKLNSMKLLQEIREKMRKRIQ